MGQLSGDECFKAADGLEVTQVPDGFVVYDEQRQVVHYLNPTAALVYTVCDGTRTVEDIRRLLCAAYDIEDAPDLEDLFARLEHASLVCRAG